MKQSDRDKEMLIYKISGYFWSLCSIKYGSWWYSIIYCCLWFHVGTISYGILYLCLCIEYSPKRPLGSRNQYLIELDLKIKHNILIWWQRDNKFSTHSVLNQAICVNSKVCQKHLWIATLNKMLEWPLMTLYNNPWGVAIHYRPRDLEKMDYHH